MRKAIVLILACLSGGRLMASHWTPVGAPYEENMPLTCIVQINGEEQATDALEVGVFCGEECRGAAQPVLFPPTQRYIFQITVFGEVGDTLTFKLFDHELNEELGLTPPDAVTFSIVGYGTLPDPHVLNFRESTIIQTASLAQGWNWRSCYVEADDLMEQMKTGLGSDGKQIKSQNKFTQYNAMLNMWIGQLNTIDNEQTYMIQTNTACTVELTGRAASPADHPITLRFGWNWIGYPYSEALPIATAFSNITPHHGDQVKSQNGFAQYNGMLGMWVGNLNTITPGMGLQYLSNSISNVILVYPD